MGSSKCILCCDWLLLGRGCSLQSQDNCQDFLWCSILNTAGIMVVQCENPVRPGSAEWGVGPGQGTGVAG